MILRKGLKSGPNSKQGQSERECGSWKQLHSPLSAAAESTLMFKAEHGRGKSEDAFLLFKLKHAEQRANSSKFALSQINEFQLEVKYTEGKFAPGQKSSASVETSSWFGFRA